MKLKSPYMIQLANKVYEELCNQRIKVRNQLSRLDKMIGEILEANPELLLEKFQPRRNDTSQTGDNPPEESP